MRKLSGYGPSLIVLLTAAVVLLAGPKVVQQFTYEQTRTRVIQARLNLADGGVLQQINQAYRDIATAVEPSVVHVSADYVEADTFGNERRGTSAGSGWVYDDQGHIVTNHHVIQNAQSIDVQLHDGTIHRAELIGSDPTTDIAVIKISPVRIHPAELADPKDSINQGDLVFAFGSPFDFRFSMSSGVVSGKDRSVGVIRDESGRPSGYENFIQVDAAINPGNSGGPLTDFRGRVIGMNTAIATGRRTGGGNALEEGQFAGIGLAIPMDMIQPVVTQLIKQGFVEKGFMGVDTAELNSIFAQSLGFVGTGVVMGNVDPSGPASAAGVRKGDIVTQVDGKPVATAQQLRSIVSSMRPGETVVLSIWRYDAKNKTAQTIDIAVPLNRLDALRAAGQLPRDQPRDSILSLGIARMSTSNPDTTRRLGVEYLPGVLIEQVVDGSPLAGKVAPGAIITSVMELPVRDVDGFIDALRQYNLARGVRLGIVGPDGKTLSTTIATE